ncbi:hypothetical protein Cob_v003062 [Colletotrichum orbiculare MAFF 240422]|uniref:Uncharacterized protein n=1 Tax=Colletotrichum orbiculare (strain 104-T / ATCC 96160 / CBS 514.97 / LARS 414 / MAFF 240422) TaxID=1213857 RepID=A0A484G0W3_COLOR|nr:hypothetical protein Cob_v003062 [Colletotrichum orbiculare MAFF 240422]
MPLVSQVENRMPNGGGQILDANTSVSLRVLCKMSSMDHCLQVPAASRQPRKGRTPTIPALYRVNKASHARNKSSAPPKEKRREEEKPAKEKGQDVRVQAVHGRFDRNALNATRRWPRSIVTSSVPAVRVVEKFG